METTEEAQQLSAIGVGVAVAAAMLAVLLSIFALGRALSNDPAAPTVAAGGEGGGAAAAALVDVELAEFSISPNPITVAEGGTLNVSNTGSAEHNLKVRDQAVGTDNLDSGGSESLSVGALEPGTYQLYCDIAGHEAAGMVGELVVGGEGVASAASGGEAGEELTGEARAEFLRANYEASVAAFPAETEGFGNQVMTGEVQPDGSKLFELTISEFEWEVAPGEFVEAIGYNGMVPGPHMKVDVGDVVTVRIINGLEDSATSLHPHGIFMHPFEVDGVGYISHDPTMPGETYEVTFEAKEVSVGMYHGHDNGVEQVINGAFGAWTVGELPLPPIADNVVEEKVMVLNDAGNIGLTLNGKSFPATEPYVLEQGQQMLLHYYNEGLTPHPMHLHNNAQLVVAKDGYPLESPYFADTINVAPGERYSVVIFAEVPGTWVYHCHILTHVEKSDGSVFGMFTAMIVTESSDPEVAENTDPTIENGETTTDGESGEDGSGDGDGTATETDAATDDEESTA